MSINPSLFIGGGKGLIGAYDRGQQRERQKLALEGQIDALKDLSKVTPAERDYVQRRRKIIAEGDPMLKEQFQEAAGTIRQQGQFMRQRAQGQAIQQGLEKSIVAQELRRRVDKDVLTSVAEQARQLAMANRQARRQAEGEMEGMNLRTDARAQQSEYQQKLAQGQIDALGDYGWGDALRDIAGIGIGAGEAWMGTDESGKIRTKVS